MTKAASQLIELLSKKESLAAVLAPSFPIVFSYPEIAEKLRRLGFNYVVEVALGAKETNENLLKLLKENDKAKFITSPCASLSRIVETSYPGLVKYLALVDSPMVYTAKIVKEKWPQSQPVFIGPCPIKKLEAKDYPELNILVLTYRELEEVFQYFNLDDQETDKNSRFDLESRETRLYPISGGLSQSSGLDLGLGQDELQVVSGWQNCESALKGFEKNTSIRLLDILYCEGGCLNGLGIESKLSLAERRKKIIDFWQKG